MKLSKILKKSVKKPLVAILVERASFFFLIMSLLAAGLYILGNFNGFTDGTQRLLLRVISATGICLFLFGAVGLILDLFMIFRVKLTYAGGFVLYAIVGGIGAVITVAAIFIQTLAVG
ncbi:MAG: hypothetical protein LBE74_00475 [Treponema sp.]|nr:hypothetical protein [Treponema sp.]